MANASIDQNGVRSILGTLDSSGASTVRVLANPTLHTLAVSDGNTGSDHGPANALRDENEYPAIMAVSSADGVTPVAVYADSSGNLLINSN